MKELSIEEKAKAYDKAIKVIKDNLDALNEITETGAEVVNIQSIKNCFYRAFPELKESEDKKIKNLIYCLIRDRSDNRKLLEDNGVTVEKALAWFEKQGETFTKKDVDDAYLKGICDAKHELEKQGEQKPANKVEPHYNIGDVLCDKSCTTLNKDRQPNLEIIDIKDGKYICDNGFGFRVLIPISQQDNYELVAKNIKPKSQGKSAVKRI